MANLARQGSASLNEGSEDVVIRAANAASAGMPSDSLPASSSASSMATLSTNHSLSHTSVAGAAPPVISRSGTSSPNPAGTIGGHRQHMPPLNLSYEHPGLADRFFHSPVQTPGGGSVTSADPSRSGTPNGGIGLPAHMANEIWRSMHTASPSFKSAREGSTSSAAWQGPPEAHLNNNQQQQQQQQRPQSHPFGTQTEYQQDGQTFLTPRLQLDDHSSPQLNGAHNDPDTNKNSFTQFDPPLPSAQQPSRRQGHGRSDLDAETTPSALAYKTNLPPASGPGPHNSSAGFFPQPIGTRSASSGSAGSAALNAASINMAALNLSADQPGLGISSSNSDPTKNDPSRHSEQQQQPSAGSANMPRQPSQGSGAPLSLQTQAMIQRVGSSGPINSPMLSPAAGSFVSAPSVGVLSPVALAPGQAPFHLPQQQAVHGSGGPSETLAAFDSLARSSPLLGEIIQRLIRLEADVRDLHDKVDASGIGGGPNAAQQRVGLGIDGSAAAGGPDSQQQQLQTEEVRMLRAQVSTLSSSVAQLLANQTQAQMQIRAQMAVSGGNGANAVVPPPPNGPGGMAGAGGMPPPPVAQLRSGMPPTSQLNRGQNLQQQLAGLGLGTPGLPGELSPNPALSIGAVAGTPFGDRSASPMVGGPGPMGGSGTPFNAHAHMLATLDAASNRLSPRPQGGGGNAANRLSWHGPVPPDGSHLSTARTPGSVTSKDERRWSGLGPNSRFGGGGGGGSTTPQLMGSEDGRMRGPPMDMPASGGSANQHGGNASFGTTVTKWEHLNLHPDLLRAIQKYGLGPPNKIQQRSLPFLLGGMDVIAQAPPTQERIAAYVIPALQIVLEAVNPAKGGQGVGAPTPRGPYVLIVSTTVDQATQAQRMAVGLGASLGVRVHIAAAGSIDAKQEAQMLIQASPHIVVGTPAKMCDLWTYLGKQQQQTNANIPAGGEVRFVVLDEVDQLIARNLADYVAGMLRILPMSRSGNVGPGGSAVNGPGSGVGRQGGPATSPSYPGGPGSIVRENGSGTNGPNLDRQTAIFSNTVPQDVLNFASSINLRETVRVLVRRDGGGGGAGTVQVGIGHGNNPIMVGPGSTGPGSQPTFQGQSPAIPSAPGGYFNAHGPKNGPGGSATPGTPGIGADPSIMALRGLRQYYLWVPVSGDGGGPNGGFGGQGSHGREMKLDLIGDLLEDMEFGHAVIYCGNPATMEAVTYKLASKGVEAMALHRDMSHHTRNQMMSKFRTSSSMFSNTNFGTPNMTGGPGGFQRGGHPRKALVVCDLAINPKDVHQIPLVLFYDMPRSVDEYKEKVLCAATGGMSRPGVCINVVTASGGPRADIEMLRTLECHLGCKMAELPMDPRQLLSF
ncbi:hypothetical protein OC861_001892 [Tilletia horrida]|nr:hypothetical protein OC861_001892 [Tilletia horrida]